MKHLLWCGRLERMNGRRLPTMQMELTPLRNEENEVSRYEVGTMA